MQKSIDLFDFFVGLGPGVREPFGRMGNVGHSFSQTVCGNFVDEFLNDFLVDLFFTHPRTRPESFVLGRIACKLENRS